MSAAPELHSCHIEGGHVHVCYIKHALLPALRAVRDQCDAIAGEQLSALGWGEIYTGLNIIDLDDAALLELAGVPGAMSLDQATSAGSAPASKRSVRNCSRCGDNHEPIAIKQMSRPIDTYDHWGTCPTTGDPILFDLNPSVEEIERVTRETERIVGEVEASAPSPLDIYSPWHEKRAHEQVAAPAERPCPVPSQCIDGPTPHKHDFGTEPAERCVAKPWMENRWDHLRHRHQLTLYIPETWVEQHARAWRFFLLWALVIWMFRMLHIIFRPAPKHVEIQRGPYMVSGAGAGDSSPAKTSSEA